MSSPAHRVRIVPVAPSRWSLRTRLLALLMLLLATVSLVIVFVTAVALRGVLVDQLDRRLREASGRWDRPEPTFLQNLPSFPALPALPAPAAADSAATAAADSAATDSAATDSAATAAADSAAADQPSSLSPQQLRVRRFFRGPVDPGTLGAVVGEDGTYGAFIDTAGEGKELTTAETAVVAGIPAYLRPYTRAFGDQGDYRLLARTTHDDMIVVTGLPMKQVNATLTRMTMIAGVVALVGVAAAAIAGTAIVRVTLRPLRRVAATASRVAELPLDRGEVALSVRVPQVDTDPRTEVGQVGAALNRMLGHIGAALAARHASEMRMRQFLADVSHELRTPLAAISGYAELTRRTREHVPADVTYAMSRVESESARMTALVSDLLLLARLDSGRDLVREPVDVSRLIVNAVNDAHVAAPGHRFALDLPEEPVTVTGDPARLHQVLANLLANARTHTPPGTQVTASLTVSGPTAILAVVDDGPGIPPDLLPEVFQRFARGDSSRSRAAGSTGLGLAIVAAVVEAHHGHVRATSEPGRTAFMVELPRCLPPSETVPSEPARLTGPTHPDRASQPAHR
ncbi:signal transduction histidine kinase [Frankia sp. CcI6]|uniref:sensor histidine kinase n=1 Tax=unclassified Frankia TaxID=2632575 RepID=UPI0003CFE0D5|nr:MULTISPECIES: HAMP domain-containing sensor histidine kinase [unclassified Frankia]ETA02311.1 signal transduction histidine kinase [Frankia sp. CcI6]OAA22224.1 two-component system, OmpR family, sensor kinase [Frankia casuarinae]